MRGAFTYLITFGCALPAFGQFYPDSNAVWCGVDDNGGPPGYNVQIEMGGGMDTIIDGVSYKKATEYNDQSGSWQYVGNYLLRSDVSGRGYIYLPDSMAEFVTGDVTAQAGDTVYDVLMGSPAGGYYDVEDLVVDSVVVLSNNGTTVTRHYVNPALFNPLPAEGVFWQAGMGTVWGPLFRLSGIPNTCAVNDTIQFDINGINLGYVGQSCWQIASDVSESGTNEPARFNVSPNPSTGLFHLGAAAREVQVYNAQGKLLFRQKGNEVDLGAEPPGVYTTVVETDKGRSVERLVVVR